MSDSCFERLVQFYFWDEVRGVAELTAPMAREFPLHFNEIAQIFLGVPIKRVIQRYVLFAKAL